MLKIINLCGIRWVQDPDQQKKKKENAILDVSKKNYKALKKLAMWMTSCVPDPKFYVKAVVAPNHNVLKVAENRDCRPGRPLGFRQGCHAQHWRHCRVETERGEDELN